jgi:hypothetical protein
MGIFDWFKRDGPIADRTALIDFIDTRAAYIVQKGIFEFAHACTGLSFASLMKEQPFVDAMDEARWRSYPLGLFVVTEMVDGVLRPLANGAMPLAEALRGAALAAFDRYPVPAKLGADFWMTAREALGQRVMGIALHPPKAVKDIPLAVANQFHANMPIHQSMRGDDREIVLNHFRMNLVRTHDDFDRRVDATALVAELGVVRSEGESVAGQGR